MDYVKIIIQGILNEKSGDYPMGIIQALLYAPELINGLRPCHSAQTYYFLANKIPLDADEQTKDPGEKTETTKDKKQQEDLGKIKEETQDEKQQDNPSKTKEVIKGENQQEDPGKKAEETENVNLTAQNDQNVHTGLHHASVYAEIGCIGVLLSIAVTALILRRKRRLK